MVVLSPALCARTGLAVDSTAADLVEHIRSTHPEVLDGLLSSEPSRFAALESLESFSNYDIRIVKQALLPQQKYCSISVESIESPILVGLISDKPIDALPTSLENLIFWAIIDPQGSWQDSWQDAQHPPIHNWRSLASGKAIVAEPKGITPESRRLTASLFGLENTDIGSIPPAPPICAQASQISIGKPLSSSSVTQARLLYEAAAADHPKWRCLSLYRILEHAYLANVKQVLMQDFDVSAMKAVEEAKKKLGSELGQLVDLGDKAGLIAEFEAFGVAFDTLVAQGNTFITMLDREASSDNLYGLGQYRKVIVRPTPSLLGFLPLTSI